MKKLIIPLLLILTTACQPSAVYEKYRDIPKEVWNRYYPLEFTANIPDNAQYNIYLCLRHTTDYEMANLWCFVSARGKHFSFRDTVNLKIAEPDGRWLGKGGTVKTLEHPLPHNPVFLPAGNISIRLEQAMRFENMNGIKNLGIRIEKVNNNTPSNP